MPMKKQMQINQVTPKQAYHTLVLALVYLFTTRLIGPDMQNTVKKTFLKVIYRLNNYVIYHISPTKDLFCRLNCFFKGN